MASERRRGVENSARRAALVEAAEQLIRDGGYPAVTTGNLADKVGLTRQIVHYYFHSIDEVFIAVIRKNSDRMRAQLEEAARAQEPLRELQRLNRDPEQAILSIELTALANRRPVVRAEVARAAEEARTLQTRLLADHLKQRGITPGMNPLVATVLLTSLAQTLALEAAIDISSGHRETMAFVDLCLRAFAEGFDAPFQSASSKKPDGGARRRSAETTRKKAQGPFRRE